MPACGVCGNQSEAVQECVSNYESRLMLGHCFGAKPAPCGSASFCFAFSAPVGSRFLPEEVCKRGRERRTNFFRAPPRKHSLALGSRAHSLALRSVNSQPSRPIRTSNRASISPEPNGTTASSSAAVVSMQPSSRRATTSSSKASSATPSTRARRPTPSSSPTAFG
jgi:hypothetical protein